MPAGQTRPEVHEAELPSQISFSHSSTIAERSMPFHYHRIFEIYYCQTQSLRYLVGNRIYELTPGDMLILNNFDIHNSLPVRGQKYERSLILFPPEVISPRSSESTDLLECFRHHDRKFNHKRHLSEEEQGDFQVLLEKGRQAMQVTRYGSDVERRILLEEALLFVNRLYRRVSPKTDLRDRPYGNEDLNRVSEIMEYVDIHISENLSLEKLAARFNSTPNGLNRLFKRVGNFTVHQYILNRRIQYAQLYLSEGKPVTAVAYDVGYNDLAHFIRIFKEKTGITPGQFGRQIVDVLSDN